MEEGIFYFQVINRRVAVRLEPNINAPWSNDRVLEIGTVHEASQRILDGSQVFYRLNDGTGWAFKYTATNEQVLDEIHMPYFTYRVRPKIRINIRAEANLESPQTGKILQPGEEFDDCQQVKEGSQVFYKLSDHSGWAFKLAGSGTQVIDVIPNAPRDCTALVSLGVRRTPDVYAGRTDRIVEAGDVFKISRRIAADDKNQVFYEMADGSGWAFRMTPQGQVCVKENDPPSESTCIVM
jgi:hypothetical protein